ncbi:MAG: kynureninase, partial [Acidobacteria bacterium]|nr:kynureninase [Acidobacteriota bacterium]NIM63735.1 kynureninase [Acidobacteriota bacterium]NIO60952.1 kynureninase [Acidobacteriota bacterium]NIQ31967.1 kynureninase [Acidobacteriota bacterium]NIQ87421.1 kynureninase [Acidobacteriota bacterium]
MTALDTSEAWAREQDAFDPLHGYRERFCIPPAASGDESIYFCGNSLGLMPRHAVDVVQQELDAWGSMGVDAHFKQDAAWFAYHELVRDPLARVVGAAPHEVVAMNSLTVNLHLMMVSFYRPQPGRFKIVMEPTAFPSDTYAVQTQLAWHGFDPQQGILVPSARNGAATVDDEDIEVLLGERGSEIAMLLLGGVNYYTGRRYDIPRLVAAARKHGIVAGLDLAHAAGNVPLELHDWDVDFAVWCSYKYLNGGPGAVAGCFVHEKHARNQALPRFGGWWGNDPELRFRMHLEETFVPVPSADSWQLSNPSVLGLAPLRASLELFEAAGMEALRAKSERLTAYLEAWVEHAAEGIEILTPRDPHERGAQLSLAVREDSERVLGRLQKAGLVADYRRPDVIRVAPAPMYNSFHDVWRLGRAF